MDNSQWAGEEDPDEDQDPTNKSPELDESQDQRDSRSTSVSNGIDGTKNNDQSGEEEGHEIKVERDTYPADSFTEMGHRRLHDEEPDHDTMNEATDDGGVVKEESRIRFGNHNDNNNTEKGNAKTVPSAENDNEKAAEGLKLRGVPLEIDEESRISPESTNHEEMSGNGTEKVIIKSEPLSPSHSESEEIQLQFSTKSNNPTSNYSSSPSHISNITQQESASQHRHNSNNSRRSRSRSRSRSQSQSRGDNYNHINSNDNSTLSPEAAKAKMSLARQEAEISLVNHLQLPSDVLYLKQQDMNIHGTPSVGWVVCCAIPLPQGSSLGPFQGQLVSPEDVKVGDLIVQLTNKRGRQALLNVAGQSGGWLALLRTPGKGNERNTQVYWEGGRIWCEIVSDIEVGEELRATFSFQNDESEDDNDDDTEMRMNDDNKIDGDNSDVDVGGVEIDKTNIPERTAGSPKSVSDAVPKPPPSQPQSQASGSSHAALIYGCPFCGVRFSSPRTLQGHLSFYCSKKTSDLIVNPAAKEGPKRNNSENAHEVQNIKREPPSFLNEDEERPGSFSRIEDDQRSPELPPLNGRHVMEFKCQQCPYTCDKMASLHRHMRIHNTSKSPILPAASVENEVSKDHQPISNSKEDPKSAIKTSSADTFCKECRIQFSSLRTFQCHKEHYCAQRRNRGESRGAAPPDTSSFAAMFYPRILFPDDITKVGIPSALQMAALSQGGLIIPGHPSFLSPQMEMAASSNSAASAAVAAAAASMFLGAPVISQSDAIASLLPASIQASASSINSSSAVDSDDAVTVARKAKTNKDSHSKFPINSGSVSPLSSPTSSSSTPHSSNLYLSALRRERSKTPEHNKRRENNLDSSKSARNAEREMIVEENEEISVKIECDDGDAPLDLTKPKQSTSPTPSPNHRTMTSPFSEKSRHSENSSRNTYPRTSPNLSPHYSPYPSTSPFKGSALSPTYIKTESDSQSPKERPSTLQATSRSESISPKSAVPVKLFSHHPSVIIPPGQIIPGLPPMPISPTSKISTAAAPASMSKCTDCNIVFYKHDNYLVHKRHYCSGKRRAPAASTGTSLAPPISDSFDESTPSNSSESSRQHSPIHVIHPHKENFKIKEEREMRLPYVVEKSPSPKTSPTTSTCPPPISPKASENVPNTSSVPNEIRYKYYCVPCQIKFSNASILNAHKEYYCPSGKHSEQSIVMQSPETDVNIPAASHQRDSPDSSPEEFPCTRCNTIFTSSRLLRLHVCNGGFPCPHCDHVAITENRRVEHLKVHAPTRAFRCTICGYRGNTFRGMRMHGKTHIDEGLDFTDLNMLEYHEPALMPVVATESADPNADSELLRIKNEPYKRRRSRKAYEKFDFPLPKVDVPQTCPLCGQTFINSDFLSSHFKVHEIAASQYLAGLMKCIHCEYVGKSASDLRSHFEVTHTRQSRKRERSPSSTANQSDAEPSTSRESPRPSRVTDSPQRKRMVITDPNSPEDNKEALRYLVESEIPHDRRSSSPQSRRGNSPIVDVQSEGPDENIDRRSRHYISRSPSPEFSRHSNHFLYAPGQGDNKRSPSRGDSTDRMSPKSDNSPNDPPLSIFDRRSPKSSRSLSPEPLAQSMVPEKKIRLTVANIKTEEITQDDLGQSPEHIANANPSPTDDISCNPKRRLSNSVHHRSSQSPIEKEPYTNSASNPSTNFEQPPVFRIKRESSSPSPNGPDRSHNSALRSPEPAKAPITPTPVAIPEGLVLSPNNLLFHPSHAQFPYRHAFPYMFMSPPGISASLPSTSPNSQDPRPSASVGSHYCQFCDISFSKQATYIAHKKYYCSGAARVPQGKSAQA